jgi:hypothetical protein
MTQVHWGSVVTAALCGSAAILATMYILLPLLGLPRLDFAAVTGGWVGAAGRYAKALGVSVFALGGIGWAFLYARFWPAHSVPGALAFAAIPFAMSCMAVLPQLNQFRIAVYPVPGFLYLKLGGPAAVLANGLEHLIFGLILGLMYR